MATVTVVNSVTLDGVMQAPGRQGEDNRGGFPYGGWTAPYQDPVMAQTMGKGMAQQDGALLFGRRTYEDFYNVWPKRTDNPFTPVLNNTTKYMCSYAVGEPLPWENSVLVKGEARETVAALKGRIGGNLTVLGSGVLVRALLKARLVDRLVLSIYPITLGVGTKLFGHDETGVSAFDLVEAVPTTKGVIIATYELKP